MGLGKIFRFLKGECWELNVAVDCDKAKTSDDQDEETNNEYFGFHSILIIAFW